MSDHAVKPAAELDLAELQRLHDAGSTGEWMLHKGIMGTDLRITTWWRNREDGDGGICTVSKEHWRSTSKRGERGSFEPKPVKNAENDAKLIVAAVNALPELIRRAGFDGNETAWLIEWPADDYGPIRYWAAGHSKPVIDPNKATRFARQHDAVAVMGAYAERGAKVHEHMWMRAASVGTHRDGGDVEQAPFMGGAVAANSSETPNLTAEGDS